MNYTRYPQATPAYREHRAIEAQKHAADRVALLADCEAAERTRAAEASQKVTDAIGDVRGMTDAEYEAAKHAVGVPSRYVRVTY